MKMIANNYEEKELMKALLELTGINQAEFADDLGLSTITIQSYEPGVGRYHQKR